MFYTPSPVLGFQMPNWAASANCTILINNDFCISNEDLAVFEKDTQLRQTFKFLSPITVQHHWKSEEEQIFILTPRQVKMCVPSQLGIAQCYLGPIQQLVPLCTWQRRKICQGSKMDRKKCFPLLMDKKTLYYYLEHSQPYLQAQDPGLQLSLWVGPKEKV